MSYKMSIYVMKYVFKYISNKKISKIATINQINT